MSGDIINCVNFSSTQPRKFLLDEVLKNKLQAKIKKLTEVRLSDVEIAELLEIDLDLVQSIKVRVEG